METIFQLKYLLASVVIVLLLMGISKLFKLKPRPERIITIGGLICFGYMVLFVLSLFFYAIYNSIKLVL